MATLAHVGEISPQPLEPCADALGFRLDGVGHLEAAKNRRTGAPEDPGLLAADRLERVAKVIAVVQADRGDDGDIGVDRIDRIEAPAEPDLEHDELDTEVIEGEERRGGRVLEERQRDLAPRRLDALEHLDEARRVDLGAVDADAFLVATQVRGGVEPDALAGRTQHRLEEGGDRALAVGAADRDDTGARFSDPEAIEERRDALEREVHGARVDALLEGKPLGERTPRHGFRPPRAAAASGAEAHCRSVRAGRGGRR